MYELFILRPINIYRNIDERHDLQLHAVHTELKKKSVILSQWMEGWTDGQDL
jgi:hypothetical protein